MLKIFGAITLFFVLLACYMFVPERVCAVDWVDIDLNRIDGPFYTCPVPIEKRRIGFLEFTRVGDDVYRVAKIHGESRLPPRGLHPRVAENFLFIKLDGPVDWDKLRDYDSGRYLSDGKVIFNMEGRRMAPLTPPLQVANLRPVPSAPGLRSSYETDGFWVIRARDVVEGADAATFRQVVARESDGTAVSFGTETEFGRDRNAVYHGNRKFEGADPDSFGMVSYNLGRDPPPGIHFDSDSVPRGWGWVALDRKKAWEVDPIGVTRLVVTAAQLKTLQKDLQTATTAAANVSTHKSNGFIREGKPRNPDRALK